MAKSSKPDPLAVAERLHSGAIRLLRRVRTVDSESGLSAPKLSALSVLTFGGQMSLTALARAEQVRAPTMSKLVGDLEAEGLAVKRADKNDARGVLHRSDRERPRADGGGAPAKARAVAQALGVALARRARDAGEAAELILKVAQEA